MVRAAGRAQPGSGSGSEERRGAGADSTHPDLSAWSDNELVGAVDIAARLGVSSKQVVLDWRYHAVGFPHPVARTPSLRWRWGDVRRWAQAHPRHVANFRRG